MCAGQGSRCGRAETHELGEELRKGNTRHSVSTRKYGRAPIPHHTPAVTRRVLRTWGGRALARCLAASPPRRHRGLPPLERTAEQCMARLACAMRVLRPLGVA